MKDLDQIRARMLAAIDRTNAELGVEDEMPGLRAAIEAWPDRSLAMRLPAEARGFLERELGGDR